MINYKDKLDIIVIAGQSNAEGNGVSTDDVIEVKNDCFELFDANNYWIDINPDDPKNPIFHMVLPVQCIVRALQERLVDGLPRYDMSLSFADEYIKHGLLEKDRKIMVIKAAVGGTGFALKQQGVNNFLYKRLTDMVDLALSFNKENRIVAFLWHQGEHDAFENAQLNEKERYDFYHKEFMAQTNDFLTRYKSFKFPVISGGFCDEWANKDENIKQTNVIEKCLQDCMNEIGFAGFVPSDGLLSNNQELHNGDDIHFSKKSLKVFGQKYFDKYFSLIK